MTPKTKHIQIAATARFPVAVLGNPETADFELIALGGTEHPDIRAVERGRRYIATIGMVNGQPETHFEEVPDDALIAALAKVYYEYLAVACNAAPAQRLH